MKVPVVLLHGSFGCGEDWHCVVDRLDRDAHTPDLPAHGDRFAEAASSFEDTVDELVRSLPDRCDLVGYSMGGRVALTAACRHPERVRSLTLIGASAGLADPDERRARASADDELAELIERDLPAFVERWMANPLFATQSRLGDEYLSGARAQRLGNEPIALATSLRQASTGRMTPLHDLLDRCTMPVGLVVGGDDAKFVGIAETLARRLPDAVVHTVEAAGHAAHLEDPAAVAEAIRHTIGRA